MSDLDIICGKVEKNYDDNQRFFYIKTNLLAEKISIDIIKEQFINAEENIWDILNQIQIENCSSPSDLKKMVFDIQSETRRGYPNILICSEQFKETLENKFRTMLLYIQNITQFQITVSKEIPDNEGILCYKGVKDVDSPIFVLESKYKAHPDFKKYIRRLKI